MFEDGPVDAPPLGPGHLQHEHIVRVVVRREALVLGRCDVRVDLDRVAEFGGQPAAEVDQRRPGAMQSLQDQRGAVGELGQHLVVRDLVGDPGARSAGPRVNDAAPSNRARPWPSAGTACAGRVR